MIFAVFCVACCLLFHQRHTHKKKGKTPRQATGTSVSIILPWICALLSSPLLPFCLPSFSAPLIGPLSGWWEDTLSSDGSAAQLALLCIRARLRQGRRKHIPHQRGELCVCERLCVLTGIRVSVLFPPQREHTNHGLGGGASINKDVNTNLCTL